MSSIISCSDQTNSKLIIGSKKFTENVILGEIINGLATSRYFESVHKRELGGTRVLWEALLKGEIDIYPEYSGTLLKEILNNHNFENNDFLVQYLDSLGVGISSKLGFNNTYAIAVRSDFAKKYNLTKISDLLKFNNIKVAFTNEFMDRLDGWPNLKLKYNFNNISPRGVDHDLAYKGISSGSLDVIDIYTTDAELFQYDLKILEDDLNCFPNYFCIFLYRKDVVKRFPNFISELNTLEGKINNSTMTSMNKLAEIEKINESIVAKKFLESNFGLKFKENENSKFNDLVQYSKEHLFLVTISLSLAILLAIPLGIFSYYFKTSRKIVLGSVGIIQTIPSLALLVFMIPLFGIGTAPAIIALFLYSLLPIVRNTFLGLQNIDLSIKESAEVLGLSKIFILFKVYLPIASRSILGGIKTSAVINVGTATLGALIGAGGFGQPILTGIRLDDTNLILLGAIPAAMMAIGVQVVFDLIEKIIVPKGLNYNK